ncbi:MAG: glycosyltransferase family 2 protein [Bacteroidota bacterium]|nr:glycosyltransferase family 2 protein [Bacteroidota bacterium]
MLVSVIIPCFNVEDYIGECVQSVLAQTHQPLQVICIDNGSTDHTWKVLSEIKEKHPEIIIEKELKAGGNAARNKGLTFATAEWIQFLDADDLLVPSKIEHQLKLISSSDKNAAFVAGAYTKRTLDGKEVDMINFEDDQFVAPFINRCGTTCSNLWRKQDLAEIGNWNENIFSSQESELMLRFTGNNKKFLMDKTPLTIVRERQTGQVSQKKPVEKWVQYIEIRLIFLKLFKENNPGEYLKRKTFYYNFVLTTIITLAKSDLNIASRYFNKDVRDNIGLDSRSRIAKWKIVFIKTFGFKSFIRMFG